MLHLAWKEFIWKASRVSDVLFGVLAHLCGEVLDCEDEMLVVSITGKNVAFFNLMSAESKMYYFLC